MNISNALGKWEKKFLEGCVWRRERQNKNFSFIIMAVVGIFQREGGGGGNVSFPPDFHVALPGIFSHG